MTFEVSERVGVAVLGMAFYGENAYAVFSAFLVNHFVPKYVVFHSSLNANLFMDATIHFSALMKVDGRRALHANQVHEMCTFSIIC